MEKASDFPYHSFRDFLQDYSKRQFEQAEVPVERIETQETGDTVYRYGDIAKFSEYNHRQGLNDYGFQSTCGITATENICRQFGVEVDENTLVHEAVDANLCSIKIDTQCSGGITVFAQRDLLRNHDISARVEMFNETESLASYVEQGRGVILTVNAGLLWRDPSCYEFGQYNHAICIIGCDRNAESNKVESFFITDSGTGETLQISESRLRECWSNGVGVVTDEVRLK
jgi:hypothetical protein